MAAHVFIDGVELIPPVGSGTSAVSGSATRRLNRPAQATVRIPTDLSVGGAGSTLKIEFDETGLFFHGFVLLCETNPERDAGYTVYNATDPMELWQWRPCRDYGGPTPGNFIDPSFLERMESGPQIIEELLNASENPAGIPATAEGPLFLARGTFETGGTNISGAPATWPISMMDMAALLTSTGELDIIIDAVDSGGNMGTISCYNGDYGTDLSGSVVFEYGMGDHNVQTLRWNEDMTNISNKIQYFFGPKETIRRYKSNITGDDPCLDVQIGTTPMTNLDTRRTNSRNAYGVRMEIQEFEVDTLIKEQEPLGTCDTLDPVKFLYRQNWFLESWIRAEPKQIIHVLPERGAEIGTFDIGDLVGVSCTPAIRGGFSGAQRVYEYTISWDTNGVLSLSELQTSSDQEGVGA